MSPFHLQPGELSDLSPAIKPHGKSDGFAWWIKEEDTIVHDSVHGKTVSIPWTAEDDINSVVAKAARLIDQCVPLGR